MKKIVIFVLLFCLFSFNVNAETFEFEINDNQNIYELIYSEYVSDDLENSIPSAVNDFINSLEIELSNPFSLNNLFTKEGLNNFKDYILNKINLPIKSVSVLITTIIICAFCTSFSSNNLQAKKSLHYICVASMILIFILQLTALINDTVNVLNSLNTLMLSFIPVYAGILIAALKSGVSTAFSSTTFFLCEIISYFANKIIVPFSNCFVALSVSSGLSPETRISGLTRMIKKFSYIILSFSMSLFLAFLSIQSTVSNTVDNAVTKTAKFFISSFVPIIGPSLSEALGSFRSCISLLKSTVGIYLVIVVVLIMLPKIIEITLYKLIFTICSDVAEIYDVYPIKAILEAFNQTLSLLLAVLLCVSLMFVFSITIISIAGKSI